MAKRNISKNDSSSELQNQLTTLEILIGNFMSYWGFKSIHGRIWTHLYVSTEPLDTQELMNRLKVSKGLMSLAIRDLLEYDVIKADHIGKHGTTYYAPNMDLSAVISGVLKNRESKMLSDVIQSGKAISKLSARSLSSAKISTDRIQSIIEMTTSAKFMLSAFLGDIEIDNDQKSDSLFSISQFNETTTD